MMRSLFLGLVAATALASPRDELVRDFLAYLKQAGITYKVKSQTADDLDLEVGKATPRIALDNLERHVLDAMANGLDEKTARTETFERYASTLREMAKPPHAITVKEDGAHILPRLVSADYLTQLPNVMHMPLGTTGLSITWVLDLEKGVRYLTAEDLTALHFTRDQLHALALSNLSKRLSREQIRKALTSKQAIVYSAGDSFDAARLLLVPAALGPGEALAALVPDRDVLILAPVPRDWSALREVAKRQLGAMPLLSRPLEVTRNGFQPR